MCLGHQRKLYIIDWLFARPSFHPGPYWIAHVPCGLKVLSANDDAWIVALNTMQLILKTNAHGTIYCVFN